MRPPSAREPHAKAVAVEAESLPLPVDLAARLPLSFKVLEWLYAATDWGVVLRDPRASTAYGVSSGQLSPLAMFRALALPYLIDIESEEALAREVWENERLRNLCGFDDRPPENGRLKKRDLESEFPTRAMFWHFRHTPPGYHRDTMLKLLVALGLAADSLSLPIPCVRSMPARRGDPAGEHLTFRINPFGPQVDLWSTPRDGFLLALDTRRPTDELYSGLKLEQVRSRRRRGLAGGLGLPAEFAVPRGDSGIAWFVIDPPDWLKAGSGVRTRSKDTVTRLGSARISSYAASNVIVVRSHKGARQVLLGRQLDGRWRGEYVLPGGKAKPGESLERCTKRELEEETGLTLARSRPISIHLVRLPGRPLVFSVGAIVTEFDGTPHREERAQNEEWKWFDVGDLPSELALPAKLALGEYLKGRRQDLEWSDVELQWERSTQVPEQLGFGGPFTQDGFDTPGDG